MAINFMRAFFGLAYCVPPFYGLAYCVPFNNKNNHFWRFHLHKEKNDSVLHAHLQSFLQNDKVQPHYSVWHQR